jgi:NAD-dependent SIR2 family protein deacetylase
MGGEGDDQGWRCEVCGRVWYSAFFASHPEGEPPRCDTCGGPLSPAAAEPLDEDAQDAES